MDPSRVSSRPLGTRRAVLVFIALAGLWAALDLGLFRGGLLPGEGGMRLVGRFFAAAVSPALSYEADLVPEGTRPLPLKVAGAAWMTVVFAAAATSLSVVAGLALGFLGSSAWWEGDPAGAPGPVRRVLRRTVAPAAYGATRVVIALSRSVHELLWAVLFLGALGLANLKLAAVVAIAVPYAGTLAKVFSEMIDEAPRHTAAALRAAGASPPQVFLFGLLPRALPDLAGYAFYRFECALRSAAVLGFFGIPTLGYYLHQSFENGYYREVWSYLYALFALVVVTDWWSGQIRRRMVA